MRRMPLVDSAATRQRVGGAEAHTGVRRTKGVVTPLMYACQQSRETQVRELLAQKARLLHIKYPPCKSLAALFSSLEDNYVSLHYTHHVVANRMF